MLEPSPAPAAERITLPTPSGIPVIALRRAPADAKATLVFSPALGVHAGFYDRLAHQLVRQGIAVVQHEQRGHGDSPVRPGRDADWGYRALVEEELAILAADARARAPHLPLFVGGHSLGGQLACLYGATAVPRPAGIVVIASGVQHHVLYPASWQARILVGAALFPPVSRRRGFHDGARMGFGGREATTLITDWARVARSGRYEPQGSATDYEAALPRVELPLLLLTFARDTFAPRGAAGGLAAKMPRAAITRLHWGEAELGTDADHFGWARRPDAVSSVVAGWLKVTAMRADPGA